MDIKQIFSSCFNVSSSFLKIGYCVVLPIMIGYNLYLTHQLSSVLNEKVITLTDKIDSVSINTSGKVQDETDKYTERMNIYTTNVTQKEVQYVQKESVEDADVELKSVKPTIKVKVNGGETYQFNTLENESSKFENGKLQITSASTSNINITTDDYKRSLFSVSTAINADKKVLFGVNYQLGHSVDASIYIGSGVKPYYGLTWRIGGYNKK